MRKLQWIIPDAFEAKEIVRKARAQRVLRDWDEIVGKGLAARSNPDKVDHGVVWVSVEGSAWAQELRMMKETILDRLRERAGDSTIFKDLRFGVRPVALKAADSVAVIEVEDVSQLSIREIAERRLAKWKKDGSGGNPA